MYTYKHVIHAIVPAFSECSEFCIMIYTFVSTKLASVAVQQDLVTCTVLSAINIFHQLPKQCKQEAPLTLRGQRCRCRNINGEPQIFGRFPSPGPRPPFFYACDFMMGLGKPQLRAKFEVASPSRCRNIEEPKILVSSPSPMPLPLFPVGVIL